MIDLRKAKKENLIWVAINQKRNNGGMGSNFVETCILLVTSCSVSNK